MSEVTVTKTLVRNLDLSATLRLERTYVYIGNIENFPKPDEIAVGFGNSLFYDKQEIGLNNAEGAQTRDEYFGADPELGEYLLEEWKISDVEIPVFIAPYNCDLVQAEIAVSNLEGIEPSSTDYHTISLRDKGSDGTSNGQIASITTASVGFDPFKKRDMGTLDATHKVLLEGDVVSLRFSPTGFGAAQGFKDVVLFLEYERS